MQTCKYCPHLSNVLLFMFVDPVSLLFLFTVVLYYQFSPQCEQQTNYSGLGMQIMF